MANGTLGDRWAFGRPYRPFMSPRKKRWSAVAAVTVVFVIALSAVAVGDTTGPTITSDKPDYAPGETVILTGAGWQAGEAVHIRVDDDQERTWSLDADVTADEVGGFTYQFALPTHFVATYTVLATGEVSGTATTSFTDANIQTSVAPSSVSVTAGGGGGPITITSEVQGALGSGWKFTVPSVYTISGGTCTGSSPVEYAPNSQGGGGSQTFTTSASVSAAWWRPFPGVNRPRA